MGQIARFLYTYRVHVLFLLLSSASLYAARGRTLPLHKPYVFVVAGMHEALGKLQGLMHVQDAYGDLLQRYAALQLAYAEVQDSARHRPLPQGPFRLHTIARVVGNSLVHAHNYIILDKGSADGVQKGMGVMGAQGIVGCVQETTAHYSRVNSILHAQVRVSVQVLPSGVLGTVGWDGMDPRTARLSDIPRHITVQEGDRVVTSGYNAIYPPGMPVGSILHVESAYQGAFQRIRIQLATDFACLNQVYLVEHTQRTEKEGLEKGRH